MRSTKTAWLRRPAGVARRSWAAAIIVLAGLAALTTATAAAEPFPEYPVIKPNVDFWVDVYARYATTQAIVHDSLDLRRVYEVIDLLPHDAPGAPKVNRQRMQRAQERVEGILKRLAADPACAAAECRRVAAVFGPQASAKAFREARGRVRCQVGQKDRFRAGLIRSGAYLEEMRRILASQGLPEDLAYLPHVESSFNPEAYSKFGAAGVWQFTLSTGKLYMAVDYVLDERRDPIRATHAAAQLLKENHARLGSWPLAITAYNHGPNGMERAKRQHGDYPAIFSSYRGPSFKFASRNFYSEFLAARRVAADYRAYFGDLPLHRPTPKRSLVLEGYARFDELAAHFDVRPEALRSLNPALRNPVFTNQKYVPKGYRLHLPQEVDETLIAAVPAALYQASQKPSRFYTVQKGDTAGGIARTHGVALADLILANNLGARALIRPQQTLRIPLPGETLTVAEAQPSAAPEAPPVLLAAAEPAPAEREASTATISVAAPAATPEPPPAAPAPPAPSVSAAPAATKAGEAGTEAPPVEPETAPAPETAAPAAPLAPAGPEGPAAPAAVAAPEGPAAPPVEAPEVPPEPAAAALPPPSAEIVAIDVGFTRLREKDRPPVGELRVEVEETLGHYAEWAGVRTQQIRRLNGLAFGRAIGMGQTVRIPLEKVDARRFEEIRYEYHKRMQEDFFAVYRVVGLEPYRVQSGDNIWTLCRDRFEVPLWLLKHYNAGVELAALSLDQELMVPVLGKTEAGDPGAVSADTENGESPEAGEEGAE